MTLILGIKTLEDAQKVAKKVPGWKMWPDVMATGGVPDVELSDIEKLGFNFVTTHYMEKACMYGLYDFGRHVFEDKSIVYVDNHTMDLPTEEERVKWTEMGLDWWLSREKECQTFPWDQK